MFGYVTVNASPVSISYVPNGVLPILACIRVSLPEKSGVVAQYTSVVLHEHRSGFDMLSKTSLLTPLRTPVVLNTIVFRFFKHECFV